MIRPFIFITRNSPRLVEVKLADFFVVKPLQNVLTELRKQS